MFFAYGYTMENNSTNPTQPNKDSDTPEDIPQAGSNINPQNVPEQSVPAEGTGSQPGLAPEQSVPAEETINQAQPSLEQEPAVNTETVNTNNPAISPLAVTPTNSSIRSRKSGIIFGAVAGLILGLVIGFGAAAATGTSLLEEKTSNNSNSAPAVSDTAKELQIPEGATVISECAAGRGKQYILPKDIPMGPVYNVYDGKVTSVEYMLSQEEVLASKDFLDLPLENVKYDHINIGLLSKGHSGYPDPHYHVDVFTITNEEASKITCE